ncbi:hypothetical protein Trydic_g17147 [Trypoxylus dichotomus]
MKYECGRVDKPMLTGYRKVKDVYICQRCDRSYKVFSSMKRHLRYECEKEPQIFCPFAHCGYKAKINCRMLQHVRAVHHMTYEVKPREAVKLTEQLPFD